MYMYANVDKPDNVHIYTSLNISHLLQHIKVDMFVENSHLTTLLLRQNKIAMNYYCCIPNDSCMGTYHV
jgi:hypothetical protein